MNSKAILESMETLRKSQDHFMFLSSAKELLRVYAGEKSAFYLDIKEIEYFYARENRSVQKAF